MYLNEKRKDVMQIVNFDQFKTKDLYTLLHQILRYLRHITESEAGTIYLLDDNALRFTIFQNDSFGYEKIERVQEPLNNLRLELKENSGTLAVESILSNKLISIDNIYENEDFNFASAKQFDKEFNYKTTSILTAPLMNYFTDIRIGVVQLINKKGSRGNNIAFSLKDKEAISLTSHLITLSINSAIHSAEAFEQHTEYMQEVQKQLEHKAYTDPLTGLYNRYHFKELSSSIIEKRNLNHDETACIILDIDKFKNVNDTHGHIVGDQVLVNLSSILKGILRKSDTIIRFGGEEFVVFVSNTTKEKAMFLADKIRMKIEEQKIYITETQILQYTISLGVSLITKSDKDINTLLDRADKALYNAKQEGRNRVYYL